MSTADKLDERDNKVLEEKIQQIELSIVEGFTGLRAQHESLSNNLDTFAKNQEKIVKSIYGNGQEGLITKIARIDTKHKYLWSLLATVCGLELTLFVVYARMIMPAIA